MSKIKIHRYEYLTERSKEIINIIWPDDDYPHGSGLWKCAKRRCVSLDEYLEERIKSKNPRGNTGQKGRPMSEERKRELSEYWKGKKKSEEHTERIREAKAGDKNPMYGMIRSEDTINKYKKAVEGRGFLGVSSSISNWWKNIKGHHNVVWAEVSKEDLQEIKDLYKKEYKDIRSEERKDRDSPQYQTWRKAVFERDGYICQKTGIKGGELHAHHIRSFRSNISRRFSVHNGITLAKEAHKDFHSIYGIFNNDDCQLEEFIGRKLPERTRELFDLWYDYNLVEFMQNMSDLDEDEYDEAWKTLREAGFCNTRT